MITKNILDDENVEDIEIGACNWNIESLTQYCPQNLLMHTKIKMKDDTFKEIPQQFCFSNDSTCKFYSKYKLLKI